jgi:DNA-nicking Smr family endonuclease
MPRRHKPPPDDGDADEFARAMADVTPVAPDPRGRVRSAPPVTAPPITKTRNTRNPSKDLEEGAAGDFAVSGVDQRTLRKLKRGDIQATARLDLHGQTTAEATATLGRFIDTSVHRHRCVCIVHGRGLHSEGNVPILKTRVRDHLRRHRGVLAYTDAPRSDGGSGAVYVLLRKN